VERLVNWLSRRGIDRERLFAHHFRGEERVTLWRVVTDEGEFYRFDDEGYADLLPEDSEERERPLTLAEIAEDAALHEIIVQDASDVDEMREIDEAIDALSALDVVPQDFVNTGAEGANSEPVFRLQHREREPKEATNVWDLLDLITDVGRQGLSIIRYKGLAEMSWEQLRETTMDVTKRTLVRVKLDDLVEADRMFTVLMSKDVEPRRVLIERYGRHAELDLYGA
jgi:DNA gyrase/topoisomerase IV subunit B